MNVSDQIIQVLDELCKKFGVAIDWTQQNVMPYVAELCKKYIKYEMLTSVVWLIIGVISLIIGIKLLIKARKIYDKNKLIAESGSTNVDDWEIPYTVFGFILLTIGIIVSMLQVIDIIRCISFPELQIYKYISGQIKN